MLHIIFLDNKDLMHIVWGIVWFNLEPISKFFMGFNNNFSQFEYYTWQFPLNKSL